MPNQWFSAKNPDNPYDQVGYSYSNFASNVRCCTKLPGYDLSMSEISERIPWDKVGALAYDYNNYFRDAIVNSPYFQLGSTARTTLVELIDDLVAIETETDYSLIKSEITSWEDTIIPLELNESETFQLLSIASLLRYSILIYLPTGNEPSSSASPLALSNVWKWLAFAACVAIMAFVVGPLLAGGGAIVPLTVGGYIFWGAVGALIGEAVMELDIFK